MAKKANGAAGDKVKAEYVMLMPSSNDVRNLAKKRRQGKTQSSEIAGTIGQIIGGAVEKKHLDRKAFGIACGLDGMSDERLAITLPHLMRYIDDLGLVERANKQSEMFEEKTGEGDGKVTQIGAAARKVAQAAGAPTD